LSRTTLIAATQAWSSVRCAVLTLGLLRLLTNNDYDACALSWVRESHAHLDTPLWRAVSEWLESDWPFASVEYASRA
jgi:hypothetical protein